MKCGGTSEEKNVIDDVKAFCMEIKAEVEEKAGRQFEMYEPLKYTSQVVAGSNYFVKIQVSNSGDCIHIRMFEPLPCNKETDKNVSLHSIQDGKSKEDPVQHF